MDRLAFGVFNGSQQRFDLGQMSFSLVRDDPDTIIERHGHDTAHFQIILDGEYVTEADPANPHCGPLTTLWVPAGTIHRDRFKTRGGSFLTVSYSRAFLATIDSGHLPRRAKCIGASLLARELVREFEHRDDLSALGLEAIALHLLVRESRQAMREANAGKRLTDQVRAVIEGRAREKLSLQSLGAELGVPPHRLSAVVKALYGKTFRQVILERRVEYAIRRMADKNLQLAEIALMAGFSDQAQFTKAFRQVVGGTPAADRRRF